MIGKNTTRLNVYVSKVIKKAITKMTKDYNKENKTHLSESKLVEAILAERLSSEEYIK